MTQIVNNPLSIDNVTTFDVEFVNKTGTEGRSYIDMTAIINGKRFYLGFATKQRGVKGYTLSVLNTTDRIYGDFRRQAGLFEWFAGGLTAVEVKERGRILAGLALAAHTS